MTNIDITIAICSHNRADGLRDCLASLVRQETNDRFTYEILVIHTNSPGTAEVIQSAAQNAPVPVRGIHHTRRGAVSARNRGLREARGEWIALFDDDQTAEPLWLKEMFSIAVEKQVKSVGGVLHLRLPEGCTRQFTPRCRRMLGETVGWTTARPYTRQEGPGSGNQMIHRSVFEQVGEYDESFALRGYDTDMYRRIRQAGFESWFTPQAVGYHIIPPSRLEDAFFKETSLHNGWSFARRDLLERGAAAAVCVALARIGQAVLINWPRLGWALWKQDREQILEGRIRLWRVEGYLRSTLYALAPKLFSQQHFFSQYEFRADRKFLSVS